MIVAEKKPVPGKKEPVSPRSPALLRDKVIVPRYIIQKNHKCAICHQRFDNLEKLSKHQGQHKKGKLKRGPRTPSMLGKNFSR